MALIDVFSFATFLRQICYKKSRSKTASAIFDGSFWRISVWRNIRRKITSFLLRSTYLFSKLPYRSRESVVFCWANFSRTNFIAPSAISKILLVLLRVRITSDDVNLTQLATSWIFWFDGEMLPNPQFFIAYFSFNKKLSLGHV